MDLLPYKNIIKAIEYCESLDKNLILQCKLNNNYLRKYNTVIFFKNDDNKVDSIQISSDQSKIDKLIFYILPSKDKKFIDENIIINFNNENN